MVAMTWADDPEQSRWHLVEGGVPDMVQGLNVPVTPGGGGDDLRGAAAFWTAAGDAERRGCAAELAGVRVADGALDPERLRGVRNGLHFQLVLTEPRLGKLLPDQPPPHPAGLGPAQHGRAARRLGGRLDVQSAPDHGTTITVLSIVAINKP
jgi:hypothetical protein